MVQISQTSFKMQSCLTFVARVIAKQAPVFVILGDHSKKKHACFALLAGEFFHEINRKCTIYKQVEERSFGVRSKKQTGVKLKLTSVSKLF